MLRRDILLVGMVHSDDVIMWSRGALNGVIGKLYESRAELFYTYKNRIYLTLCERTKNIHLDALQNSVLGIIGCDEHDEWKDINLNIASLTQYITKNATCVAEVRDGEVLWIEDTWALGISKQTMLEEWSRDVKHFEVLDNKIYYIKPRQEIVEELYFKCVEIAGSELRLAKALARSTTPIEKKMSYRRELMCNIAAFRRFSFAHRKTFHKYVGLFVKYLNNHGMPMDGLFDQNLRGA